MAWHVAQHQRAQSEPRASSVTRCGATLRASSDLDKALRGLRDHQESPWDPGYQESIKKASRERELEGSGAARVTREHVLRGL